MLVLLDPRLDSHVDTATTVHFSSNGLKRHRVRWVHGLAISLDHLRGTLIAGRQVHVARVAVIGLEGLLVDLLFAATEAPQLAIREDHVHDHKSVLSERLSHEVFVPPHELLKAGITLGHQEVSVVRSANRTRDLVLGALRFNKEGERQTNVGQKDDFRHDYSYGLRNERRQRLHRTTTHRAELSRRTHDHCWAGICPRRHSRVACQLDDQLTLHLELHLVSDLHLGAITLLP